MLLLALETATDNGSLALMEDGGLVTEYSLAGSGAYLTRVMPEIEALLRATGRELKDLGAIGVSQGPGNFTGLLIGLATAKALAWALGCPLVPVPTLEVLAAQLPFQPYPVGVLMDAKRQEVYFGRFLCRGALPQPLKEPVRLALPDLLPQLQPPLALTGPALDLYGATLAEKLPPGIYWAPPERRQPRAATVASLALARLGQGLTAAPAQLVPTYLRPAL